MVRKEAIRSACRLTGENVFSLSKDEYVSGCRISMPIPCRDRKRTLIFAYQRPLSLLVFDCFGFAPCLHHEKH